MLKQLQKRRLLSVRSGHPKVIADSRPMDPLRKRLSDPVARCANDQHALGRSLYFEPRYREYVF